METYIYPHEVEDDLLKDLIQTSDCEAAAAYINKLARSLGVDPADIPLDPVPSEVKDLAIAYACGRRAKLSSGVGTRLDNNGVDSFEIKRRVYAKEVQEQTLEMTASIMKGSVDTAADLYSSGIELFRG